MNFRINRLRVEQFRRFRQPFELGGLDAGLNIVAAPNEAGKSTLVRAIRAAFFERHRSTAVEDLRPWNEGGGATPSIELDFLLDGQAHRLYKSFLGKKRCVLHAGERVLDGAQAEEYLAQRFGFGFASKGASKPEHWGVPGLLWVEQGSGQELDVGPARDHLREALQAQAGAGALAATGGDELLARLRAQRAELLTASGKARGPYAEAADAISGLEAALAGLDAQVAEYRGQVDRLDALRRHYRADEEARPWQALRQALSAARQQYETWQAGQAQLRADQARLRQIEETRGLLIQSIDAMARQQADAQVRAAALRQAEHDLRDADAALAEAGGQAETARRHAQAAAERLRQARLQDSRASLQRQYQDAQAEAGRAQADLERARQSHQVLMALRAAHAQASALDPAQWEHLRKLGQAVRDAGLRRQAVATRLRHALPSGHHIDMQTDGRHQRLQADGEQLLDGPAVLRLADGGTLTIMPGGEDLPKRAQDYEHACQALDQALRGLGLDDLAQAQARLSETQERLAGIRLAEQALAIVAPQGLDPLHAALEALQARCAAAQAALAALPPADADTLPLTQAETEHAGAATLEQRAAAALAEAKRRQGIAQARHAAALAEHTATQAALDDPERQRRLAAAQQQLLAANAEHAALAARIEALGAQLREARPDILEQDIDRLQRSIEQMLREHQARREQILVLENTLEQAGAQGLEEQRATAAGALAQARRRHDELRRRAMALDLLCRKIEDKRQATLARLQAPLLERLEHYLSLLMPGASLRMGADLAPGVLVRNTAGPLAEAGQVADLSFGAREQLALLSRFAYADLLQQAGRPTMLILDDALVHSDADRLAQMKRALFDAARRHQVLLFTCHPEDWRDMGVALRTLDVPAMQRQEA